MRLGSVFSRINPFYDRRTAVTEALVGNEIITPEATETFAGFDEKLADYAAAGRRKGEIILDSDETKYALKAAARDGDTDFIKALQHRNPDLFRNKSYWVLKEALVESIVHKHLDTVRFLLEEVGVDPDYTNDNHSRSDKFPQWDALFVASTGIIPTNFIHEPGTDWSVKTPADDTAKAIFDLVLTSYFHKYITNSFVYQEKADPDAFLNAIERQFELPDNNTYWAGDYHVGSTKSSYASTLSAARPNLAVILQAEIRDIKAILNDPDPSAPQL